MPLNIRHCISGWIAVSTLSSFGAIFSSFTIAESNQVHLTWQEPQSPGTDGFELLFTTNLTEGIWTPVEDRDLWPCSTTNWSGSVEKDPRFFKIRNVPRGNLVEGHLKRTFTPSNIVSQCEYFGVPTHVVTYAVSAYPILYDTFDPRNISQQASGMLLIPVSSSNSPQPPEQIPVISLQHGTIFANRQAPSGGHVYADLFAGILLSTDGYAVIMPDYLGFGTSAPQHPYLHLRSEGVASIDMLRAGLKFMTNQTPRRSNGQLFLTGYSQGGHATLALQKELEQHHAGEFQITASAPMAGPHDLSGTMLPMLFSKASYAYPAYIPFVILGLNSIYQFGSPSDFFAEPYAKDIPPMFDGTHFGYEINDLLPAVPGELFAETFVSAVSNDVSHPLAIAAEKNDTYRGWFPKVPTRFFHCAADDIVPYSNSVIAVSAFIQAGSSTNLVSLVDPLPSANHFDGFFPSINAAKTWFNSFRN